MLNLETLLQPSHYCTGVLWNIFARNEILLATAVLFRVKLQELVFLGVASKWMGSLGEKL
jgi:hypothetical protein